MEAAQPGPTPSSERIQALDAMRGVAIMGVLLAETVWSLGSPPQDEWNSFDLAVGRGMDLFVDGKFLSLFACLFGVGVALQWGRWEASGDNVGRLHVRRMGFLAAVGLVHGLLLRNGDILAPYAILGLLLFPLRRVRTGWIIALAILLLWVPYLSNTFVRAAGLHWPARPDSVEGGYLVENWKWLSHWYMTNPLRSWPTILALMSAGMLLARSGVVRRLATDRRLAGRVLIATVFLAVASRVALELLSGMWQDMQPSEVRTLTIVWLSQVSTWALAAAYGALFLTLCQVPWAAARLGVLKAVGRMAFTNYLTQALIVVPLCLAFGWFDQVTPGRGLLLALAIGTLQVAFSVCWLRTHSMGPFERLWRRATYGTASS